MATADPDGLDWLLPIPGDVDAVRAEREQLERVRDELLDTAYRVGYVGLHSWTGPAAASSLELRLRLVKVVQRAADAYEDAATALGRYEDTLAHVQLLRRMSGLEAGVDPTRVRMASANEDVARWREQARNEAHEAARCIRIARERLGTIGSAFRDAPPVKDAQPSAVPAEPPTPPYRPARPTPRAEPPRRDEPDEGHDPHGGFGPYSALTSPHMHQYQMDQYQLALAKGQDLIYAQTHYSSWEEWSRAAGRGIRQIGA